MESKEESYWNLLSEEIIYRVLTFKEEYEYQKDLDRFRLEHKKKTIKLFELLLDTTLWIKITLLCLARVPFGSNIRHIYDYEFKKKIWIILSPFSSHRSRHDNWIIQ